MSDVTATALADPAQAGGRTVATDEAMAALGAAQALGFAIAMISLDGATSRDEALARIAPALRFPDGFGHNWDALADALGDLSWWPAPGYVVTIDGFPLFASVAQDVAPTLRGIVDEVAADWCARGVAFHVLWLRADAPAAVDDDGGTAPPG